MAKQRDVKFTDTKRVKDLVALMAANDLTEIELVEDKSKITLKRAVPTATLMPMVPASTHPSHTHGPAAGGAAGPGPAAAPAEDEDLVAIKSPMVGTFYSAPNPESDPYVTVGALVGDDTVVCIIEAMKVFNEIRAETSGAIAKILVSNGQAVEFGQPMFMVRPD